MNILRGRLQFMNILSINDNYNNIYNYSGKPLKITLTTYLISRGINIKSYEESELNDGLHVILTNGNINENILEQLKYHFNNGKKQLFYEKLYLIYLFYVIY